MDTAASSSPKKYDVFISFRGEDTRVGFTSHLYAALCQKDILTYKDDNQLPRGDEINPSLMQAIEDSNISVVVFSENYANSKWCLNELLKIIECKRDHKQIVIPVFYKVDPSHVRRQEGTFKDAFETHERDSRLHKDILNNWKNALFQAGNLAGWTLLCTPHSRNESEFIGDIVKDILQKLELVGYPTLSDKRLVGMDENCDNIKKLLKEAQKIGIWGMGGIGKTTMAETVFDELSSEFEGSCFLRNVREESERHGLSYLPKKLLSELLKEDYLSGVEPSTFAMTRLSRKKVFIVLDDVTSWEQLEYLAKHCHGLGQGSKVIITTRDKHLLIKNVDVIHEAKALTYHNSLQLFNLKAFHKKYSATGYEELAKKAVDYAKGIPLALEVLGSFLQSRSIEEWKDALARLEKTPNQDIHRVLKLSFDELSDDLKEIFLDIAFFINGEAKDVVLRLLKASDSHGTIIGLGILVDKALISIIDGTVWMHDLIQEMGWEIVRNESIKELGKRSRLRDPKDIYSVLKNNTGSDAVEGIMLNLSQLGDICLNADSFKKMINLRFLKFYHGRGSNCNLNLPFGLKSLPNELKYFQWDNYPLNSLPSTFNPENLVRLKMRDSQLKKLWDGIQNFVNLKSIDLRGSEQLTELPDFSKAQNLEDVYLGGCTSLCYVHSSILSLHKLVHLDLYGCEELKELKSQTHLESLTYLQVSLCSSLTEFSLSSKKMEHLYLNYASVEILGSSIGRLCKLRWLYIDGSRLKKLPVNELRCLRSLEDLRLVNCKLVIDKQELHILFEALRQSLRRLYLEGCCNITELPDNMKHLSRLQHINLTNCSRLQSIPELPPSTTLGVQNCLKLNESLLSRIEDSAYFSLKRWAYLNSALVDAAVCYPGSKVPKWFKKNQRKEASCSITIDLSSSLSNLLGFVLCCVIPQSSLKQNCLYSLKCKSPFEDGKFFARSVFPFDIMDLNSDHVCVWIDTEFLRHCHEGNTDSLKISFLFYLDDNKDQYHLYRDGNVVELNQACGVCPIYASEYHNFLQQIEMEFERGLKINRSRAIHELSLYGVMEYALFSLNPEPSDNFETNVCHTEHVIPKWFTNQSSTTGKDSISISLSPDINCLLGFVFCFLIPQFSSEEKKKSESSCRCYFPADDEFEDDEFFGDDVFFEHDDFPTRGLHGWHYSMKELNSDKVFIWYDPLFCEFLIEELRRISGTIEEGLRFQFEFGEKCLIKECGVRPIYASEYSDFLQQTDLKHDEGRKLMRRRDSDDVDNNSLQQRN